METTRSVLHNILSRCQKHKAEKIQRAVGGEKNPTSLQCETRQNKYQILLEQPYGKKSTGQILQAYVHLVEISFKIDEEIRTFQAQTKVVYDH